MRLHGIEIPVQDMDRAYRFYRDVLQFPVIGRFGDGMAIFFLGDVHGGMAMLVKAPGPQEGHGPRLILTADGIDRVRAQLEAQGVTFLGGTDHSPLGMTAPFLDSEGNQLALFDNTITAHFREQARTSNAALADALADSERKLIAALDGLSEEAAAARPAPEEWPILGHLAHIVDSLDSCGVIARDLSDGREPPRDRLLRADYPVDTLDAGRAELARAFADAHRWMRELPEEQEGGTKLVHGVFGGMNGREWAAFMLFHIGMHTSQIEAILPPAPAR